MFYIKTDLFIPKTVEVVDLTNVHYYFKLDPNVRNPTEVLFGRMEIEGLLNKEVIPIRHFYDVLNKPPISYFTNNNARIQDYLLNLRTAYGNIQGYYFSEGIKDLTLFIERLAYTREIYVCLGLENTTPEKIVKAIFPHCVEGKNLKKWISSVDKHQYCLFRVITNQFFLEQINNVILCSQGKTRERQVRRIRENINRLIFHIQENIRNYVPKFPKDYNWKEFEDFVDEPKEITLYLTHFYGPPYKAKFHPRMIKALINFSGILTGQITGDFFLGCGTLAIESALMNIDTRGSDINPLGEIVTKAKVDALRYDQEEVLKQIGKIATEISEFDFKEEISPGISQWFKGKEKAGDKVLLLNRFIRTRIDREYQDFFLCALARVTSYALKKRNSPDLPQALINELWEMWKFILCLNEVKKFLHIPLGKADIQTDDIRKLNSIGNESTDLIVTSPPYSTAIDYVKLDLPQLLLLQLIKENKELDEKMIGTQRKTSDMDVLATHISHSKPLIEDVRNRFFKIPANARQYILDLMDDGNVKTALHCYKFLYDMWDALEQMHRVLKSGGRCIIIIGNNVFAVKGERKEFQNGTFLEEMALNEEIGFDRWRDKLVREYSKSSYGTILKEDIIFLEKSSTK